MGSQDQHRQEARRTGLTGAISQHFQQKAADTRTPAQRQQERVQGEQEQRDTQAAADAKLYGGPGWEALSDLRRLRATQYTARQTEGGADDAA